MIRPLTCVCMLLAGGAGLYLYQVKHRAQLLDREVAHVVQQTADTRERTKMLRDRWAELNEPGRLQTLADRFLQLRPLQPGQWVQPQELASRLPPPAATPAAIPTRAVADQQDEDETPVASASAPDSPPTAATRHGTVALAQGSPVPVRPAAALPRPPFAHVPPQPPAVQFAERHDPPRHDAAIQTASAYAARPMPLAAPRPVGAGVLNTIGTPVVPGGYGVRPSVQAVGAYAQLAPPVASSLGSSLGSSQSSSLGMARPMMLAPPVPVASGLR